MRHPYKPDRAGESDDLGGNPRVDRGGPLACVGDVSQLYNRQSGAAGETDRLVGSSRAGGSSGGEEGLL